LVTWWL